MQLFVWSQGSHVLLLPGKLLVLSTIFTEKYTNIWITCKYGKLIEMEIAIKFICLVLPGILLKLVDTTVEWADRPHQGPFLSLARSKLRLCSANHRPGYWSNLPCDWPSTAWAYSEQKTENGPRSYQLLTIGPCADTASRMKGRSVTCVRLYLT